MSVRGKTVTRGYGAHHQRLRARLTPMVQAGNATCWRCLANGKTPAEALIHPGEPWDLGHDDHDRSQYMGPEHRACNRSAGARNSHTKPTTTARRWWKDT